jgi:hypothetical protein
MINKKKKVIGSFLLIGILTVMFCSLISAIGVSSLYGKTNVLEVYPGEEKNVLITVEGMPDEGDMTINAEVTNGAEIASLIDGPEYSLLTGERVTSTLKVQIPDDAQIDKEYVISVKYGEVDVEMSGEGTVSFVTTTTKTINVLVVEQPEIESEGISMIWIILGIVLVVIVIAVIWFMNKSKKEQNSVPVK